jgi:hypothetical protein
LADVFRLSEATGRFATRSEFDKLAKQIEQSVDELSDSIAQRFFSHSAPRRVSGSQGKVTR